MKSYTQKIIKSHTTASFTRKIITTTDTFTSFLPVAPEGQHLASLPVRPAGGSGPGRVVRALLVQPTALTASRGLTTLLTVLVFGVANPVKPGVLTDLRVGVVDHDDLEPLVHGVLTNPVRVENPHGVNPPTHTALGNGTKGTSGLLLVDTLG